MGSRYLHHAGLGKHGTVDTVELESGITSLPVDADDNGIVDMLHIISHALLSMLWAGTSDDQTSGSTVVHDLVGNVSLDEEVTLSPLDVNTLAENVQIVALDVCEEGSSVLWVDEANVDGTLVGAKEDVDQWPSRDGGGDIDVSSGLVEVREVERALGAAQKDWNLWLWLNILLLNEVTSLVVELSGTWVSVAAVAVVIVVRISVAGIVACVLRVGDSLRVRVGVSSVLLCVAVVLLASVAVWLLTWCLGVERVVRVTLLGEEAFAGRGVGNGGLAAWGLRWSSVVVVTLDEDLYLLV